MSFSGLELEYMEKNMNWNEVLRTKNLALPISSS
jgi:hypothetical protein